VAHNDFYLAVHSIQAPNQTVNRKFADAAGCVMYIVGAIVCDGAIQLPSRAVKKSWIASLRSQ
jgi:hypothetical protein